MDKIRIMFVCHGNICRSPMAEFIFKKTINDNGVADKYVVSSSATSTEEIWNGIGNPVYPPAKRMLEKYNISCEGKRAVQLKRADYKNYDYFIGMDEANIRNMHSILGDDREGKIKKLMDFTSLGGNVADPWYTGDFQTTYDDILKGCIALYEFINI